VETSYLRLRALPMNDEVKNFVARHDRIYVVEQNRDGQLADLVRLEVADDQHKIRKLLHYTGLPCDARFITNGVLEVERHPSTLIVRGGVAGTMRAGNED
jgi:2-oxoglutarate/2-oxoacid ferredoxin oxidoreductase subunit alpha